VEPPPRALVRSLRLRADRATVEEDEAVQSRDFTPTVDLTSGEADPAMMGGA